MQARRQRLARANVQQAAVGLETAHRGHQHHAGGGDAGLAALDVEELLQPHVGAKARLGHHIVGEAQGDAIGDDGGVAVGDVGEGAGVHQHRGLLRGLHQGRLQRVFEQHRHGAGHLQLLGGDGLTLHVEGQLDAADAGSQVLQIGGQRQYGHQLGGGGDDEAIGALHPIARAALTDAEVAQGAIVHVQGARPEDVGGIDVEACQAGPGAELLAELVFVEQAGIQRGSGQVVGGGEGVEIAGQVQVHLLHRHHLGVTATGGAPLDPEHRAQARLAYGGDAGLAYVVEPHGEAQGGDRLALAERGRGDGAHQHQLARPFGRFGGLLEQRETQLALVVAIGVEQMGRDGEALGQLLDRKTGGLAGDLDIA
ncbi:hypothetical protein D3C85_837680 [compost metagenome]